MKMKEFGPKGGMHPWRPLRSAYEEEPLLTWSVDDAL